MLYNNELFPDILEYASANNVPVIRPQTLALVRTLVAAKQPRRVLEIGCAVGYSALHILSAAESIETLVTLERDEKAAETACGNFKKYGRQGAAELIVGDARALLETVKGPFDFVFIDANKSAYPFYYEQSKRLLGPLGMIVADNVLYNGLVLSDEPCGHKHRTIVTRLRAFLQTAMGDGDMNSSLVQIEDGVYIGVKKE